MQQTLNDHIASLEKQIVAIRRTLRQENLSYAQAERELALLNAEEALSNTRLLS